MNIGAYALAQLFPNNYFNNMAKTYYLEYAIQPQSFGCYPLAWEELFQRAAPLAVEVGFGNGEYLVNWARQRPDWNFTGIELSMESMERLQKRIHKHSLANICPILEDARFALREFFPDNSVHHVIMNFPDPWPKERHQNRRLLDAQFIETLAAVLREDHYYELVSDQQWYAEDAHQLFDESPYFVVEKIEQNPPRELATKYEKKWQQIGRDSFRVLARKTKSIQVNRILKDSTMPHAIIEKEIPEAAIKSLTGFQHREEGRIFVVKNVFHHLDKEQYLLQVVAKDKTYKQSIHILVYRHGKNRWLVKLDSTVQPYRTPAVKMAVWKIGEILNQN